jgi:hypothetical protein
MDAILAELAGNGVLGIVLAAMIYWVFTKEKSYNQQQQDTSEYIIKLHAQHAADINAINVRHEAQLIAISTEHRTYMAQVHGKHEKELSALIMQAGADKTILLDTLGRVATAMEHQSAVMEESVKDRDVMQKVVEAYVSGREEQQKQE